MNNKIFIPILIVVIVIVAIAVLLGTQKPDIPQVGDNSQNQPEIIVSDIDTSDWQTYRNEELGFEFRYPGEWNYLGHNLKSFAPIFRSKEGGVNFEIGFFDNTNNLSVKEWVEGKNFFQLSQIENSTDYQAHGIEEAPNLLSEEGAEYLIYFGRASGGGSFGTAIINSGDGKNIVLSYSLSPRFENLENEINMEKIKFKRVVSVFKYMN